MGACLSSDLDEQLSFYSEPQPEPESKPEQPEPDDRIQPSSTEDAFNIPSKDGSLGSPLDSPIKESPSSVALISKDVIDLGPNPEYSNPDSFTDLEFSNLDRFTYDELRMATLLFRKNQVLGEGGFGVVYKGIIDDSVRSDYTRTEVAVKELNPKGIQGVKEWLTELNYLARLEHPNLVKLIGYCCEGNHRLLVYEYMAAGSLEDNLFIKYNKGSRHPLSWRRRMKIAVDAAKGLAYLHAADVIHRDFKSSNILLDEDFNAKLSDFGIAKNAPVGQQTHVSTQVMGTKGYTAPDYMRTGHLRASTDIYAFGVVLLELLMGLKANDKSRPSNQHSLVEWATPILPHKSKTLEILDPGIDGQYSSKNAIKVAKLAQRCLDFSYTMRPHMDEILATLESVLARETSFQKSK